jgi:membrane-associated phospholipid phosphatase
VEATIPAPLRPSSRIICTAAWGVVVTGAVVPLVRRRLRLPVPVVTVASTAAPVALCVALRRTPARDVGTCALQMWAYLAHYEMPNDDHDRLLSRVRVDYPVRIDRVLGLGELPGARLQRLLGRPGVGLRGPEQALVWCHWLWFLVPHGTLAYILARRPERFERAALHTYAVFDVGLVGYWALPTAPPWYAAQHGRAPEMRRMMVEHGETFWKHRWAPLYRSLAGNPLAAMPSLHFATSVMAARLLAEEGRTHAAVGWTYAGALGFALVYLGEHYVVDLLAGLVLTEGVRRSAGRAAPLLRAVGRRVQALEGAAHG